MHTYVIQDKHTTYTRISKVRARQEFDSGTMIVLCPCKLRPGLPFCPHTYASKEMEGSGADGKADFDKIVASFVHYNTSWEAGYYPAFYLTESR